MKDKAKDLDQLLDQALAEIRDTQLDPAMQREIAERTWERLSQELPDAAAEPAQPARIGSCADFQALIPAFVAGELAEGKALLLRDHVGECVPCRRALKQARTASVAQLSAAPARRRSPIATWSWRLAAAAAIVVALIGLDIQTGIFTIKTEGLITIERISGEVRAVTDEGQTVPLSEGQQIDFEDVTGIRTAKDSGAVLRLADNTLVEMNERAELAVSDQRKPWTRGRPDGVIELDRGSIIVEASDQGSGQLFVRTDDANVAVTGTVFAVNHGVKGSRVSVIEGEVMLAGRGGGQQVLHSGQQSTTSRDLARVPVEAEIAWSLNAERHLALLKVAQEIEQALQWPGLRYDTTLVDLAPRDTVLYVGIPNVSSTLSQAYDMLQDKIGGNELLNEWWNESVAGSGADAELQRVMDKIRTYGEHLGDEIVFTLPMELDGDVEGPVVMARLTRPDAFRELVASELKSLADAEGHGPDIRLLETGGVDTSTGAPADGSADLYLWTYDDYLVVTHELRRITDMVTMLQAGGSDFREGAFHDKLTELYREGVEWIFAADLETIFAANTEQSADAKDLERMGLLDLQHVIAEIKNKNDRTQNRVVLTFDQPRKGLASWLAEPGPMGAMDFISPDATVAAGFVMREPREVVDELFSWIADDDAEFERSLAEFRSQYGIDVREDIAGALGGEFAFALDGPILPTPSWKLIVEVYDPERLQATLDWAVERLNEVALNEDRKGLRIVEHQRGRQTYYQLESLDLGISAHYTFVDGYMVASASRALLNRTLKGRQNGITLPNAGSFTAMLPTDGEVNFSAVIYQNMESLLGPLASLGDAAAKASPELQKLLGEIGAASGPSLTLAYGEPERISFVSTSRSSWLTSSLGSFLRWDSLLSMQELLSQAAEENDRHSKDDSGYRIEG